MDFKHLLAKGTSVFLVGLGLYQTVVSIYRTLFLYPQLAGEYTNGRTSMIVQEQLIEKALILYATMIVGLFYGSFLLLTPSHKLEVAHTITGVVLAILSIVLITQGPVNSDPVVEFFKNTFFQN